LLCAGWPLAQAASWLVRRRRGGPQPRVGTLPRLALAGALLFNGLWVAFGFGFIARSVRMFERGTGLVFGVPPWMRLVATLPWIMAVLGGVMIAVVLAAYRLRWWDAVRRAMYALVVVGAVLTVAFLVRWNYLPAVF
jgi:hypothetical protein